MKPKIVLLSKEDAEDLAVLVKLFKQLTGREPTEQEIADAKKRLEANK
jgi:hypothetical protein